MKSVFQLIPNELSGAGVRALCRPLEFFRCSLGEPCVNRACSVLRGIAVLMLEQVFTRPLRFTDRKNILDNCPHMSVIDRCKYIVFTTII